MLVTLAQISSATAMMTQDTAMKKPCRSQPVCAQLNRQNDCCTKTTYADSIEQRQASLQWTIVHIMTSHTTADYIARG
eukprot:13278-Heterococcus_DN1.PRE.1